MKANQQVARTRVKYDKATEQWVVYPYNYIGRLLRGAIYFACDKQDADETAVAMINYKPGE